MILVFMFSHVICYDIMFLQQYHAGHEVVIYNVLVPQCHDMVVLQISRLSEGSTGQIFATSSVIYQMKMWGL